MGKILVSKINNIPPGSKYKTTVDGKDILIVNIDGKLYAIDDTCTHAGASLFDGELKNESIVCDWHGAEFNCTNGTLKKFPAQINNLKSYKIKVESGDIFIEI